MALGKIRKEQYIEGKTVWSTLLHNPDFSRYAENCGALGIRIIEKWGLILGIGHGFFVGWVEHPDIFCWVSFLYPTYLRAIFVLSAKPNKLAEDRIIPEKWVQQVF